jgi:benzoyl-CoA reductase subunit B
VSETTYMTPERMLQGIDAYLKASEPKFQLKATGNYLKLVAKNIENAIKAHERGQKYVVHSTQFPNEFFIPFDIQPLFNELYSTILGMFSLDNAKFIDVSDELGFPCDNCSYYRAFYGTIEKGLWPIPDFVCYSSSPCDQTPKGQEGAARMMGVPSFGMDRPYTLCTPQAMAYWRKEHEDLIKFLEAQTGMKMDYDRLKEVAQQSKAATELYLEINKLRATIPTPVGAEAVFAAMAAYRAWVGTAELVEFFTDFRDELQERVDKGIGAVEHEKFRYACATTPPFFDLTVQNLIEERYGGVQVMDILQWWREDADWMYDPDDPVGSLAYRVMFHPSNMLHGPMSAQAEQLRQMVIKQKPDGIIFFNHVGCRHGGGGFRIAKDMAEQEFGIPFKTIDMDTLDKRFVTKEGIVDDLDEFFEMVEQSQPYKERMVAA